MPPAAVHRKARVLLPTTCPLLLIARASLPRAVQCAKVNHAARGRPQKRMITAGQGAAVADNVSSVVDILCITEKPTERAEVGRRSNRSARAPFPRRSRGADQSAVRLRR